ncbi:MAG TPA: hypothetical protein PLW10_04790 [Myxococcota bacterium]|nr:hypothetical protein [Myxococcota bacterium]
MWTLIECAGHPRDMGLAQGGAERAAIRRAISSLDLPLRRSRLPSLRPLVSGPMRGSGAGRELFRHFAHQSERLEGLARGAGVPLDSLLELHLRVRAGGEAGGLLSRRAALRVSPAESGAGRVPVRLERSLPRAAAGEPGFLLRESRPVVGFRSVEVTLPWLVSSVAGVNEGGLAVIAGPMLWGEPGFLGWPPSLLLVQECLQRFEDLSSAVDWCTKRPVEGEQTLVLADASGAVASVIASGRKRRVQPGEGEIQLEAGEPPASEVESGSDSRDGASGEDRIFLDPGARRLRLEAAGTSVEIAL